MILAMEMNMRTFESDREMYHHQLLDNCMLEEPSPHHVAYYSGQQQEQGEEGTVGGGDGYKWQMKHDDSIVLTQVPVFHDRSSPLSRSSSQLSMVSTDKSSSSLLYDSSAYSVDNHHQDHGGVNVYNNYTSRTKAASLCSPLSQQQLPRTVRSGCYNGSSSLQQSFPSQELQEFDDRPGGTFPSHMDQYAINRTSAAAGPQDFLISSLVDSLVNDSTTGSAHINDSRETTTITATKVEFSDWNHDNGHYKTLQPSCPMGSTIPHGGVYSSPVNVLDFSDSLTSTPSPHSRESGAHNVYFSNPHLQHQQQFQNEEFEGASTSSSFQMGGSCSQEGNQDQYHWMMSGDHSNSQNNTLQGNDFLYQSEKSISPEISFQGCNSLDLSGGTQASMAPQAGIRSEEDLQGVRLVHLLLAGAEAVASMNQVLATTILTHLRELASPSGSTMQRVAACFCDGLHYRLQGVRSAEIRPTTSSEYQNDSLDAFQVLHEVSPYIKFGHFTANQAILEAVEGEKRVHIIDYEILEGIQWPSLMQALACRPGGPPQLRITAISRPYVRRASTSVQETGKRLAEFAQTFNIPFAFHQIRYDDEDDFRHPGFLRQQVKGECLVVNCMVHLPHMSHRPQKSLTSFFRAVRRLSPKVVTFVAEELPSSSSTFITQFFEALHHYSAIFDSLEASLSAGSRGRKLVERIFLAPRIINLMTSMNVGGSSGCSEGGIEYWHSLPQREGFQPVPLSMYNHCQAKLLLGLFSEGYKLEEEQNRLLLGWRSKCFELGWIIDFMDLYFHVQYF
ncbi:hypothetical protein R1sor_009456 [Riccia sorocarpa]|uniref:Uncharacterized protein n=1 Tax=Riccia sorocarpa TaxID=122646 RepID=A0ABD3HYN0_9MARC